MKERYPCVCCGHLTMDETVGSYQICPVCFWEDDQVQLRTPDTVLGANRVPLVEAQRNYLAYGACDEHARKYVRPPQDDEPLERGWRPIDLGQDVFEEPADSTPGWIADGTILYWWRATYWKADRT
ncbi:CPCC family cysteine-rich protein [Kribbella sp. DT2]|uniref:CPCC family cysteine-rich protein n=1 Tax=Kribbella sp. DT2 TaxID=3393427 RepID=UPI003CF6DE57